MTLPARLHLATAAKYNALISALGVIWLLDAAFQAEAWLVAPSANANLLHAFAKPAAQVPAWLAPTLLGVLHAVRSVGPGVVAEVMVAIAVLLGLAILARAALDVAAGFGLLYSLVCWVVLNGIGFPYAHGQTDPGVFLAYAISFLFVLAARPSLRDAGADQPGGRDTLWDFARLAFGLLWLFDAGLKWLPAFMFHFTSQITSVIPGQPHWIAVWLGFVATVVAAVGPVVVAVLVAIAETVIAFCLLTGWGLNFILPGGILYVLAVWSTAEAFGGPYTMAGTGVRGNVIGNVIIYVLPFLFLWVRLRERQREPGLTKEAAPAGSVRGPAAPLRPVS